jgi:broad specificity phosphatase PhoE
MPAGGGDAAVTEGARDARRRFGRIIVVRHGKPALDREAGPRLDWRSYRDWWSRYEETPLAAGQSAPPGLLAAVDRAGVIYASPRPRALETARALAGARQVSCDPLFVEAPLPPPRLSPRRRYLPKTWNKIARIAWLCGHSDGDEPVASTRARAEAAASQLIAAAERGEDVVLAAHGWFNRMLRRPLARRGWRCVRDGGDAYWSYRVYQRR